MRVLFSKFVQASGRFFTPRSPALHIAKVRGRKSKERERLDLVHSK